MALIVGFHEDGEIILKDLVQAKFLERLLRLTHD